MQSLKFARLSKELWTLLPDIGKFETFIETKEQFMDLIANWSDYKAKAVRMEKLIEETNRVNKSKLPDAVLKLMKMNGEKPELPTIRVLQNFAGNPHFGENCAGAAMEIATRVEQLYAAQIQVGELQHTISNLENTIKKLKEELSATEALQEEVKKMKLELREHSMAKLVQQKGINRLSETLRIDERKINSQRNTIKKLRDENDILKAKIETQINLRKDENEKKKGLDALLHYERAERLKQLLQREKDEETEHDKLLEVINQRDELHKNIEIISKEKEINYERTQEAIKEAKEFRKLYNELVERHHESKRQITQLKSDLKSQKESYEEKNTQLSKQVRKQTPTALRIVALEKRLSDLTNRTHYKERQVPMKRSMSTTISAHSKIIKDTNTIPALSAMKMSLDETEMRVQRLQHAQEDVAKQLSEIERTVKEVAQQVEAANIDMTTVSDERKRIVASKERTVHEYSEYKRQLRLIAFSRIRRTKMLSRPVSLYHTKWKRWKLHPSQAQKERAASELRRELGIFRDPDDESEPTIIDRVLDHYGGIDAVIAIQANFRGYFVRKQLERAAVGQTTQTEGKLKLIDAELLGANKRVAVALNAKKECDKAFNRLEALQFTLLDQQEQDKIELSQCLIKISKQRAMLANLQVTVRTESINKGVRQKQLRKKLASTMVL
eukprot:TRINITY_DN43274_c0_g1_i1.p1 TRINITY_DN43274_c0_g1~~TRINITY_DN43274_c0_g1_i1.p1  ORF type:complete len:672 (-),score=190.96 TRINITY_DN43274_c0_g1_i1:398-2413(-)